MIDKQKDNFCILPFIHLAVESNGEIKGCCWTPPFQNEDGSDFNINRQSPDSIYSNKDYKGFVESFRKNQRHPYCKKCWRLDDGKSISNRKKANHKFISIVDKKRKNLTVETQFVELTLGNTCNLKCRICNPMKSSQWGKELYKIRGEKKHLFYIDGSRWVANKKVWSSKVLKEAGEFHILGGEPFLEKNHIQFLKTLVHEGRSSQVSLWYNTNGTVFNKKLMDLLREFKKVRISISLDDVRERFEYQRYPGKWGEILENLGKISEYNSYGFKIGMDICWSLMNLPYFKDIIQTYEKDLKQFFVNRPNTLAHSIHFYSGLVFCPQLLKTEQKAFLITSLRRTLDEIPSFYNKLVKLLVNHISVERHYKGIDNLRMERIREIDKARNQDYRKSLPRLYELLSMEHGKKTESHKEIVES